MWGEPNFSFKTWDHRKGTKVAVGLESICASMNIEVRSSPLDFEAHEWVFQPVEREFPSYVYFEDPELYIKMHTYTGEFGSDFEFMLRIMEDQIYYAMVSLGICLSKRKKLKLEMAWQKSYVRRPIYAFRPDHRPLVTRFLELHPEIREGEALVGIHFVEQKCDRVDRTLNPQMTLCLRGDTSTKPVTGPWGFGHSRKELIPVHEEEMGIKIVDGRRGQE